MSDDPSATDSRETLARPTRGAPLVATPARIAGFAVGEAALAFGLGYAYIAFAHSKETLASLAPILAACAAVAVIATVAMLIAEESRLHRELRTARTGTAAIRGMVLARRQRAPLLLRMLSTTHGTAAVLLAEGERAVAVDALDTTSPIMAGGLLGVLREVVRADVDRAGGSAAQLKKCVDALRAMAPLANVEAERYRTHVLVKAVLGGADGELAEALASELAASSDDELHVYAVWLRTWFEIEDAPTDGELRLALLLARSQGAADLAKKLEARVGEASPLQRPSAPST
jgi:hypothetical protein